MALEPSLRTIFEQALEFESIAERSCFLNDACRHDPRLRQRIDRLLQAHIAAGKFLSQRETTDPPASFDGEIPEILLEEEGRRIGRYKILQKIGEGGCGMVYMAEQEVPVRRQVALKIIKLGMDTRAVIARFEAERQALAMMDHPNIATV